MERGKVRESRRRSRGAVGGISKEDGDLEAPAGSGSFLGRVEYALLEERKVCELGTYVRGRGGTKIPNIFRGWLGGFTPGGQF